VDGDVQLSAADAELVATVDERFQSFNVEMVEVTGGRFWAPYGSGELFEERDPIDLTNTRLRNLARELAPAFMRVSGSWANGTYYDLDETTEGTTPEGFVGVLTRTQWDEANAFAIDLGFDVITSFAVSEGTRDSEGVWTPDAARAWLEYSRDQGYPIVAAEFYNEPSYNLQGVPGDYDAQQFVRDFQIFTPMVAETLPTMMIVGPGMLGEATPLLPIPGPPTIVAADILADISPVMDVFTYHFYPGVSPRCLSTTTAEDVLTLEFLSRIDADADHYEALRDEYEPGIPMWITETAEAACGGSPWAAQYVDAFRYLDQMGRLAARGTDIVMHNTLSASEYGLIDEATFTPRPSYWGALLWQRLMGERALGLRSSNDDPDLRIYAHCLNDGAAGAAAYLLINLSQTSAKTVGVASSAELYLLTSDGLESSDTYLNDELLEAAADGTIGELSSAVVTDGQFELPAASIAFVVDEDAGAVACGSSE
jgi:hypothetical protein